MFPGGQSPEELETLMEDAFILRDGQALAQLFQDDGVLVAGSGYEAQGQEAIARAAGQVWSRTGCYIAGPRRILQSRDIALLVGDGVVNVARRGRDRSWRFVISWLGAVGGDLAGEHQPLQEAAGEQVNQGGC